MGKKIRITKKQLKEDEIASFWADALLWVQVNYRAILIGAAAAIVLLLFYNGLQRRSARKRDLVNIALAAAQMEVQAGLRARDEDSRNKSFDSAEDKLRTIINAYKRSKLLPEAVYLLANIYFYRNDYDQAERYYLDYIDRVNDPIEKAQGHIALGYVYENKFFWDQDLSNRGLLEQAEERFRRAEGLTSGTAERYLAMLCRARIYDLQADKADKALELYAQIARERKLDEPLRPDESMMANIESGTRLFSLANTAQIRKERLEAER